MNRRDPDHNAPDRTDVALMLAFKDGDEDAFVTLYRRYRDRIVTFAGRLLSDTGECEEAAQETFLKLYQARERYRPASQFSTFLYRIATNHCLNIRARVERRRRSPDAEVERSAAPTNQGPEAITEKARLRQALRSSIAKLPAKQAGALLLCHYEGLSYREAADVLGVTEGAVKSLLHRARERLQTELSWAIDKTDEVHHAVP